MKIDPRHLVLVRAIVDHGTFNRAAVALGMSQPALSKSIALLESRIGVKIFDRGVRGSTLTEAGEIIARSAHNLQQLLSKAHEEIVAKANRSNGPLVIGATPSMIIGVVPDVLGRISNQGKKVAIRLIEGFDDIFLSLLTSGEIDILVGPVGGITELPLGISESKFAEEEFFIGVGHDHPLSSKKNVDLRDLVDEAWVLPIPGSGFYRTAQAIFMSCGMAWPNNQVATGSLSASERLVSTGGRIALMTSSELYGRNLNIHRIRLNGAPSRSIGVRFRTDVLLPPIAEQFKTEVAHVMRNLSDSSD